LWKQIQFKKVQQRSTNYQKWGRKRKRRDSMGELSFSLLFVAKMPRRAIGRHVAVLPTATAATSPPLNSAGLAGRASPAELEAHRRWRPEGRVGPETRTARQPLPPRWRRPWSVGASRPLGSSPVSRQTAFAKSFRIGYHVCVSRTCRRRRRRRVTNYRRAARSTKSRACFPSWLSVSSMRTDPCHGEKRERRERVSVPHATWRDVTRTRACVLRRTRLKSLICRVRRRSFALPSYAEEQGRKQIEDRSNEN